MQFYGGPKDGEILINITQASNVLFYEEKESSKKVVDPSPDRKFYLHKYELVEKPDGDFIYQYRGIV